MGFDPPYGSSECSPHGAVCYSERLDLLLCLINPQLLSESSFPHLLATNRARIGGKPAGGKFINYNFTEQK